MYFMVSHSFRGFPGKTVSLIYSTNPTGIRLVICSRRD